MQVGLLDISLVFPILLIKILSVKISVLAMDLSVNIVDSINDTKRTASQLFDTSIAEGRSRAAKFVAWAPSL